MMGDELLFAGYNSPPLSNDFYGFALSRSKLVLLCVFVFHSIFFRHGESRSSD